tara:strand:+ start:1333 stop:1563 length:231 start_codon:yes stop_codon:yes gene_type:complete
MIKFNVMGHMKWISQMIQDGTFDNDFVPTYEQALADNKTSFWWQGESYTVDYADTVIELVKDFRKADNINAFKKFE